LIRDEKPDIKKKGQPSVDSIRDSGQKKCSLKVNGPQKSPAASDITEWSENLSLVLSDLTISTPPTMVSRIYISGSMFLYLRFENVKSTNYQDRIASTCIPAMCPQGI
jgi:hypothetical protein